MWANNHICPPLNNCFSTKIELRHVENNFHGSSECFAERPGKSRPGSRARQSRETAARGAA